MTSSLQPRVKRALRRIVRAGVRGGVPASWTGYRVFARDTVREHLKRTYGTVSGRYEVVHPEQVVQNALPQNVRDRNDLSRDSERWGYSFWDVPQRKSAETFMATVDDVLVTCHIDPKTNKFTPALFSEDERFIGLRGMGSYSVHREFFRHKMEPVRLDRATWVAERAYDNYSHWLTGCLPKIVLLKQRGLLGDVLLPPLRSPFIADSLRRLGLDPGAFRTFDPSQPLKVAKLTVLGTERLRGELLRPVRAAMRSTAGAEAKRRVYISRRKAPSRRLLNEDAVWACLEPEGFESVAMETLSFDEQVDLMQETRVLAAPHGAGLTNMLFCPQGARIVEIASPEFPNPNFYALASAMGHDYWLVNADLRGSGPVPHRDLHVPVSALEAVLPQVLDGLPAES